MKNVWENKCIGELKDLFFMHRILNARKVKNNYVVLAYYLNA